MSEQVIPFAAASIALTERDSFTMVDRSLQWCGVARFGGVGDNLMAASPLRLLKEKFGHVEVLTQVPQCIVFENSPYVDKLTVVDSDFVPKETNGAWQRYFEGRSKEYRAFYHLSHSCETTLALLPGQTHFWWPAAIRRRLCGRNYLEFVHDICEVPYEFGPLFFPTEAEREQAQETKDKVGDKVIVWVISGTRIDKRYPQAPATIARLIREVAPVVMIGAPPPSKDHGYAEAIYKDVVAINGSSAGLHMGLSPSMDNQTWPLRRVLTFAQYGDVTIGPDTGPMWATAFEPNGKIMLLSHASPENITKYWHNTVTLAADPQAVPCWPCHQLHDEPKTCRPNPDKTGSACISSLRPEAIIASAQLLLDQPKTEVLSHV